MAGNWGGFWSSGVSPIYGRTGPNFDKYYTMPNSPPEPTFGGGMGGNTGGKPSSVGQQMPDNSGDQWVNPLTQRYFGDVNNTQQTFWQTPTGMPYAYAHYVSQEARPDTHYANWLDNQRGWMADQYTNQNLTNPSLMWTDFIASKAKELAERYTAAPTWQQGQNVAPWFAGRRL